MQTVPGVYIQEISTLPASVAPVATAVPAFVGYTSIKTRPDGTSLVNVPVRIESLLDFEALYGAANPETSSLTVTDEYNAADELLSRTLSASLAAPSDFILYYTLQMYFNNGGGPCYIVCIGDYSDGPVALAAMTTGIAAVEVKDEPTLLVFPDAAAAASSGTLSVAEYGQVVQAALSQCDKLQDRFTLVDAITDGSFADVNTFRGAIGNNDLKYGAAYYPFLQSSLNYGYNEATVTVTHNKSGGTPPASPNYAGTLASLAPGAANDSPGVYRALLAELAKLYVVLPPSGAIAGIYASVDSDRGVWKAPANVSVTSALGASVRVTNGMQDYLNVDATSGKSINAIRTFAGRGLLVWGARTLAGNDNEWRYVPVRRLFIFAEESIKKATEFVVFEPNDRNTWIRVKAMIENFLTGLWRDGALQGAATDEAFFVKVGLGETMTPLDILEGRLIVEVGMAAVRPAEFIILKFSHKLQES